MQESVRESKGRWAIASVGAITVTVILLLLIRLPAPITPLAGSLVPTASPKATVKMARPDDGDMLLKEEAQLRDLRPLFLPTERNAALPEPRLEPGRTFLDNETLKLTFSDAEAQVSRDLPPVAKVEGKPVDKATPVDALSLRENGLSLQSFGRTERTITPFDPRGGYVEVTNLKDGSRVLGEDLPVEARPSPDKPWGPVEFMAVVDAAGLVSPLIVTDGSRVEEIDAHFRVYLAQSFRIGARLSPGFYRIAVAP